MSLQTDVQAAATAFIAKVADLVTNAGYIAAIVTGPATGPTSQVTVGSQTLKTIARVIAEAVGRLGPMRGDWSSVTAYASGDVLRRLNKIYVAMQATTNNDPSLETNGPNWFLFVDPQTSFNAAVGAFSFTGDITPAQITAQQDDYAPASFSTNTVLRLSTDASRHMTGLAGGTDGRLIVMANVGANDLVLDNEGASSTAANRFAFPQTTVKPKCSVVVMYDATLSRWNLTAGIPDVAVQAVDPRLSYFFYR